MNERCMGFLWDGDDDATYGVTDALKGYITFQQLTKWEEKAKKIISDIDSARVKQREPRSYFGDYNDLIFGDPGKHTSEKRPPRRSVERVTYEPLTCDACGG